MLPITALLLDPCTPLRPTARVVNLLPNPETFAECLGCRSVSISTLDDGTPIVMDAGPLFHHLNAEIGGHVCVMRKSWPDAICGPILITGGPDQHGRPTSLTPQECLILPAQFMAGWLTLGTGGTVKMLTRLTVV